MKEVMIKKHFFVIHETNFKKNSKKRKKNFTKFVHDSYANYTAGIRKGYVKTNTKLYEYEFGRT